MRQAFKQLLKVVLVLLRDVIGLAVDFHGVPLVALISSPTPLWFTILLTLTTARVVAWLTLPTLGLGFGVLLEIVVYLTHRPVVEHWVIHTTIGQLDNALL